MKKNRKENLIPFDMTRPPVKTPGLLMSLIWGISYIMTRPTGLKMHKSGMKGVKPPYLVLSTHQGFADYYIAPLIMFPHRPNYISDMEGFAAFGKNLYRDIGCIGKRRYVPDITVMRNIEKAFDMGNPVVVYPEARHSNIGTTHVIPKNMGRLAKYFAKHNNTPLVMLRSYGVYLTNPFWDEEHTRRGNMDATLELVYTADELMKLDEETIQAEIEKRLQYNEYDWQAENNLRFRGGNLAEGLHLPLYKCCSCGKKYTMESRDDRIGCRACRKVWKLFPNGKLYDTAGKEYSIVDWYNSEERDAEAEEIGVRTFNVTVEALANADGFVNLGKGTLTFDKDEFRLNFRLKKKYNYKPVDWNTDEPGEEVELHFPHKQRNSVQTEYNYRGRGPCIVLSHKDVCYYLYSEDKNFNPTELQFLTEKTIRNSET